jgi:ABC-type uncharacterized transport system auxiliary subunit
MKPTILLLAALGILLLSCGKKAVVRQYYVIEIPAAGDSTITAQPPLSKGYCEILPIQIAPAYSQKRIAVRMATHQLNYYFEHEWAVRPEEAFTAQIESYLQSRSLFAVVTSRISKTLPEYELQTRIHRLEALREKKYLAAHLSMEWQFFKSGSGEQVVYHTFDESRTLEKKSINLLASAISDILEEELKKFADKIYDYLEKAPENSNAKPQGN